MSYLRVWGTHLRWAALCSTAWEIVFSNRVPLNYSTPPSVEESRKVHDDIVKKVEDWFSDDTRKQYISKEPVEYVVRFNEDEKCMSLVVKPDLYVLWGTRENLVNLVVEVTARSLTHVPLEWLTAEMLGFYVRNLRPTFVLLIQLDQPVRLRVRILPLSTGLFKELKKLVLSGTKRKPTSSLCYNCDLRVICPSPLV